MKHTGEHLPLHVPVGGRTIKTALAVLLAGLFMQYVMKQPPFFACLGAVVAMERSIASSLHAAVVRNLATVTGGLMGIVVATLTNNFVFIALGLIPFFFISNKIGRQETILPGATVYFAITLLNTDGQPWAYGLMRLLGTFIGTAIAIAINALVLPPKNTPAPPAPGPDTEGDG